MNYLCYLSFENFLHSPLEIFTLYIFGETLTLNANEQLNVFFIKLYL